MQYKKNLFFFITTQKRNRALYEVPYLIFKIYLLKNNESSDQDAIRTYVLNCLAYKVD